MFPICDSYRSPMIFQSIYILVQALFRFFIFYLSLRGFFRVVFVYLSYKNVHGLNGRNVEAEREKERKETFGGNELIVIGSCCLFFCDVQ